MSLVASDREGLIEEELVWISGVRNVNVKAWYYIVIITYDLSRAHELDLSDVTLVTSI